jgi:hypothetical protein
MLLRRSNLTFRSVFGLAALLLMVMCSVSESRGQDIDRHEEKLSKKWLLSVYGGPSLQDYTSDIPKFQATFPDDTYVIMGALARQIYRYKKWFSIELEGQAGRHFGEKENFWEFVGVIAGRWHAFPWNKYLITSFGLGEGVSYYTQVSEIERAEEEDAGRWLHYLYFEFTFGLPQYPSWDALVRLHHRSSVNDYLGVGESNFLCFGLKYSF